MWNPFAKPKVEARDKELIRLLKKRIELTKDLEEILERINQVSDKDSAEIDLYNKQLHHRHAQIEVLTKEIERIEHRSEAEIKHFEKELIKKMESKAA